MQTWQLAASRLSGRSSLLATITRHATAVTCSRRRRGACNCIGIRLWTEEPFTNGFLQTPRTHAPHTHAPRTHAPRTHAARTHAPRTHAARTHAPRTHAARTHAPRTHMKEQFEALQAQVNSGQTWQLTRPKIGSGSGARKLQWGHRWDQSHKVGYAIGYSSRHPKSGSESTV